MSPKSGTSIRASPVRTRKLQHYIALPSLPSAGTALSSAAALVSSMASFGVMPWVAGYWGYRATNVVDDVAERASFVVTEAVDDANAAVRDVLQEVIGVARWAFRAACAVWCLRLLRIVQNDLCSVIRVSRQTAAICEKLCHAGGTCRNVTRICEHLRQQIDRQHGQLTNTSKH